MADNLYGNARAALAALPSAAWRFVMQPA